MKYDTTIELYFIGSWIDNDIVYLDVSINPSEKELALFWGKEFNQLAVYDVVNQKTIYLNEESN